MCCGASLRVESSDDGTSFYVCIACGKPADADDETRGFALRYAAGVRKAMSAREQPTAEPPRIEIEQASNALTPFVNAWNLPLNPEDLDLIAYVALRYRDQPVEEYERIAREVRGLLEEHGRCGSPFGNKIPLE